MKLELKQFKDEKVQIIVTISFMEHRLNNIYTCTV